MIARIKSFIAELFESPSAWAERMVAADERLSEPR